MGKTEEETGRVVQVDGETVRFSVAHSEEDLRGVLVSAETSTVRPSYPVLVAEAGDWACVVGELEPGVRIEEFAEAELVRLYGRAREGQ